MLQRRVAVYLKGSRFCMSNLVFHSRRSCIGRSSASLNLWLFHFYFRVGVEEVGHRSSCEAGGRSLAPRTPSRSLQIRSFVNFLPQYSESALYVVFIFSIYILLYIFYIASSFWFLLTFIKESHPKCLVFLVRL